MSIWGSMDLVSCWNDGCTGCDDCGTGNPYAYKQSHVLPEPDDPRTTEYDGIDCGYLPRFVRFHRDHPDADYDPEGYEPWLRFSLGAATVVLDRAQVQQMVDRLGAWLTKTAAEPPQPATEPCTHVHSLRHILDPEGHIWCDDCRRSLPHAAWPPPAPGTHESDLAVIAGPPLRVDDANLLASNGWLRGGWAECRRAAAWSRANRQEPT